MDLIDRALQKGVILNADLIVTVAEVPLLAANLRLALASVETMLKYGVMSDWLTAVSLPSKKQIPEKALIAPEATHSDCKNSNQGPSVKESPEQAPCTPASRGTPCCNR